MTAWHRGPMLALDTETTGPNPDTARIVTCTMIAVGPDGITATHEWLVNPGIPIPLGASEIHGVTTEYAQQHGQDAAHAIADILTTLAVFVGRGVPIVAFNAAFDMTVLYAEARRHHCNLSGPLLVVDPHVIDKHVDPYRRGKRTLTATSSHYGVELTQAHHSLADALAAARLAFKLAQQYPAQLKIPLPDLHAAQRGWRFEQAASLQSYFRRTDPSAVVNGDWPIQTLPAGWTPEQVDETEEVAS